MKGSAPEKAQSYLPADVVLVGCVKSKRPHGAAAKDLYTSDYFSKMRSTPRARVDPGSSCQPSMASLGRTSGMSRTTATCPK